MDGFETCERLKRSRMNASVPVVFMTGLTETEHVVRALDAGGVDYLTKPVAPPELVARVGVHLANARLTQSAQAALDTTGRYLLAMDRGGTLVWSTPQAGAWLGVGEASIGTGPSSRALPDAVVVWGLVCAADPRRCKPLAFAAPRTGRMLEASYVGQISANEVLLRLVSVDQAADEQTLRDRLKLTAREAEVLLWVGRGKTNRDIADILGLSPRTINKHLEQIFAKIGVENRASAAVRAVNILQED
jgi:DNA-binding NarL/FixJ family response regulator